MEPVAQQCTICQYETGTESPAVVVVHCGHSYCHHCLVPWLAAKFFPNCPSCRADISLSEQIEITGMKETIIARLLQGARVVVEVALIIVLCISGIPFFVLSGLRDLSESLSEKVSLFTLTTLLITVIACLFGLVVWGEYHVYHFITDQMGGSLFLPPLL